MTPAAELAPLATPGRGPSGTSATENIWRAPLMAVALAVTAGVLLDRYRSVPLLISLLTLAGCLLAWLITQRSPKPGLPLVYLALAAIALGAGRHHAYRDLYSPDDISYLTREEPAPVKVRGVLASEPWQQPAPRSDPLRSHDWSESTRAILEITHLWRRQQWQPVSGRAWLRVEGVLTGIHAGDTVEVVGQLSRLTGPANPGEHDMLAYGRDQRVLANLKVRKTPRGVTRLERSWPTSAIGWLAMIRGWGQSVIHETLPPSTSPVVAALLLGEGAPMRHEDWQKYIRTGVIHVLAISGQHLMILALFLGWALRLSNLRQRHVALIVAGVLLSYALITGMRPPALRASVTVCAASAALIFRRHTMAANLLALAWLVVILIKPTDLFNAGCQFSFLAVAVLYWGTREWSRRNPDPLEAIIEASRPLWLRVLRWVGRKILLSYALTLFVWVAITPLTASRYHLISPIGVLLGPILTGLTAIALLLGFLLLLCAVVCWPLTALIAPVLHGVLSISEFLVDTTVSWPGSYWYVGDIPEWWLWVFYLGLFAFLTQTLLRKHWRWGSMAGLGWLCVGLLFGAARLPADELRCTFLAVGHGTCTVLETPDGQTLLYDVGALSGPEVVQHRIAPFLWRRGIRRIDEVFLSHADLDHFSGMRDLLERFAVSQVTCNPTFAEKDTPAVRHLFAVLEQAHVPVRTAHAGQVFQAGEVTLEVLHPPGRGPPGAENARSLVLEVRHLEHTILLTGDLEEAGLTRLLALPARKVHVLMAPHHGSPGANPDELATWARPEVVVASQGRPWGAARRYERYTDRGARYLSTWKRGAVTVHSHRSGLVVETYIHRERFVVNQGGG
jgi:competence protein ComEC